MTIVMGDLYRKHGGSGALVAARSQPNDDWGSVA